MMTRRLADWLWRSAKNRSLTVAVRREPDGPVWIRYRRPRPHPTWTVSLVDEGWQPGGPPPIFVASRQLMNDALLSLPAAGPALFLVTDLPEDFLFPDRTLVVTGTPAGAWWYAVARTVFGLRRAERWLFRRLALAVGCRTPEGHIPRWREIGGRRA